MHPITRSNSQVVATIANNAAISDAIDNRNYSGGSIITPATLNATTVLGFKVSDALAGTYVDLRDQYNAVVQVTVAVDGSHAYPLPDQLFGCHYFKIWCQAAGVDVAQTGAKVFTVSLKG